MLLLASTSDKISITTSASCDVDVHASWVDKNGTTVTPGRTNTNITTATTTDVVASPAASTYRNVKQLIVRNAHATDTVAVTIIHTDGTTAVEVYYAILTAGQQAIFVEGAGWTVTEPTYMPIKSFTVHGDAGANFAMTNATQAERFAGNATRHLFMVDLSGYTQVRLRVNKQVGSASANTPLFRAKYYTSYNTTVGNFLQLGESAQVETSMVSTGYYDSGWMDLATGARNDGICIGFTELGGDGVADPAIGATDILFR